MATPLLRCLALASVALIAAAPAAADGEDNSILWRSPVSGARAYTPDWAGLRLWAAGAGFSVGRRSAGYGLQGGATLPLARRVGLTASYRLIGYSLGERLGEGLEDVEERSLAPFLGIDVQF
jgi:hypothetical protein